MIKSHKARNQAQAPLAEAIAKYAAVGTIRLHTPGHAGGQGWNTYWQRGFSTAGAWDVTELTDLANGRSTEYWVSAAQELAAEAFGAKETFFLTGGSSLGILAVLTAFAGPGDEVLLPRNAHQSVIHGLALCGATPRFMQVSCSPDGIAGSVTPEALETALREAVRPRLVLLLSPSYQGFCPDLAALVAVAHRAGVPVFVDEAHGAHFPFHAAFPPSASRCGADAWVQSAHKTLGAFTGSAMLHIGNGGNGAFSPDSIKRSLQIHSSTSPSYLLMASIDETRRIMSLEGQKLWGQAIWHSEQIRKAAAGLEYVQLVELAAMRDCGAAAQDPTRIIIGIKGLRGSLIAKSLRIMDIVPEYFDNRHVCLIIPYSITDAAVQSIIRAIKAAAELAQTPGDAVGSIIDVDVTPSAKRSSPLLPPLPQMAMTLRQALTAPFEEVTLAEAVGRIAAASVAFYPPGIPLVIPGEKISIEIIEYIQEMSRQTGSFPGPASAGRIWVVAESAVKNR